MKNTEHFLFQKPDAEDFYNVQNENENLDKIDSELYKIENPDYEASEELEVLTAGESIFKAFGKIAKAISSFISHLSDKNNPHGVTVEDIGAADAKHTHNEYATKTELENKIDSTLSDTSTNALQNKVITKALNGKMPLVNVEAVTDFNTLTETGIYRILIAGCDNAPSGSSGTLFVFGEGEVMQYYFLHDINSIYVRTYYHNTEWQSWKQLNANSAVQDGEGNVITETYAQKKVISSGDFNDMVTPGFYTMKSASANKPTSGNYYGLLVLKSDTGNYVEQIAFKESSYEMYIRTLSGTSWSAWEKVFINSKDISSSTSITATGRYALDAVQNNALVEGTLANRLTVVETNMSTYKTTLSVTAYLQSVQVNVVRRNNKTVDICLFALRTDGYDVPTGIPLATIPEGYRPNTTIFAAPAILINGISSGAIEPCCVNVTAEGEINNLLRYTTASGFNQIYFHISYIMD